MRLYVASSWRNVRYPGVVSLLRNAGHTVYDFRNPGPGQTGFQWEQVGATTKPVLPLEHHQLIKRDGSQKAYWRDYAGLATADACVLVLPSGKSAHLEAGWAAGAGKPLAVYLEDGVLQEPELMYNFGTLIWREGDLLDWCAAQPVVNSAHSA